jgi:hypothetical protein
MAQYYGLSLKLLFEERMDGHGIIHRAPDNGWGRRGAKSRQIDYDRIETIENRE